MPLTIRFPDYREFDFDDLVESRMFADKYVDEITDLFSEDRRLGEHDYNDYIGPGSHCDECGREYGYYCIGPVKYGFMFICKDCKRQFFQEEHGIRDVDLGIR